MILDSFKNKTPCFHRTILIQIDSPLPHDDTQAVSRQSDVELHNKSSPKLIFHLFCLWFWNGSKNKSPCFHRTISIQIDSPLPQMTLKQFQDNLMLNYIIKATPNLIFHLFCLWFWMALKIKLPVSTEQFQFRLTVHYPRMTLKQFQDNLMLNYIIKALQISYSTSSVCDFEWLLKIKVPASTEQFQFRLTVHYPMMTLKQFQDNLMLNYIIKALQISYSTSSVCDFGWLKNKTPCFHRTISIQIDSPLPQDDTQAVSRQSDVELQNKSTPNLIFHLFCLWFWIALKIKLPTSTEQFNSDWQSTTPWWHSSSFKTIWCWIT